MSIYTIYNSKMEAKVQANTIREAFEMLMKKEPNSFKEEHLANFQSCFYYEDEILSYKIEEPKSEIISWVKK